MGGRDHHVTDRDRTLDIDGPTATCGHCRFVTALAGKFSVEDGLLVWRGDADLQPRRGPDLESCCESDPVIGFERVEVDSEPLSAGQLASLRRSQRNAVAP